MMHFLKILLMMKNHFLKTYFPWSKRWAILIRKKRSFKKILMEKLLMKRVKANRKILTELVREIFMRKPLLLLCLKRFKIYKWANHRHLEPSELVYSLRQEIHWVLFSHHRVPNNRFLLNHSHLLHKISLCSRKNLLVS